MPTPELKVKLLELLYEAKHCATDEKAAAWNNYHAEVDRIRAGTVYSRAQVTQLLMTDGYQEYAKRRRLQERAGL